MKTKPQKVDEIKKAEELLAQSKFLAFAEFGGVPAEEVRKLRVKAKEMGANVMMLKKRLLNVALKNKGIDYDVRQFDASVGTVFSPDLEKGSGALYGFFSNLGENKEEKAANIKKILGGFDMTSGTTLDAGKVIAIGQLPPREIILAQFMGMLVAPLRTFMYILQEKAKMMGEAPKAAAPVAETTEAPKEEAPLPAENPETTSEPADSPKEGEATNTETSAESNPPEGEEAAS